MGEISEKATKLIKDLRRDMWIDVMFTPEKDAESNSLKALSDHIAKLETLVNELIKAGQALTRVAEWRYTNLPELLAWDTLVENIYKEREE